MTALGEGRGSDYAPPLEVSPLPVGLSRRLTGALGGGLRGVDLTPSRISVPSSFVSLHDKGFPSSLLSPHCNRRE